MGKIITIIIICILSCTKYVIATTSDSATDPGLRKRREIQEIIEVVPQNDMDSNGCIQSKGYKWCNSRQECIDVWDSTPCNDCKIHIVCNVILKTKITLCFYFILFVQNKTKIRRF